MTPEVACQEINRFCSSLINGQVTLKLKEVTQLLLSSTRPTSSNTITMV